MKKELVLIGAADSIGVPYSKDNYNHIGFYEMIELFLAENYKVISINCFHLSTNNDNKYINYLLDNEVSLFNIKEAQNNMLKKCKYSGIYPFLEIPKSFFNNYKVNDKDNNIIVKDYIKNHETIFIYSAFVNDLLKLKKLSLFKLLVPGRIKRELDDIKIDGIIKDIENNIIKLIKLNSKIKIYIVGLFIPTKISYIRNNLREFILMVNESLSNLSNKYENVIFINNDNLISQDFNNIDFHPNRNGHEKIYQNFLGMLEIGKNN